MQLQGYKMTRLTSCAQGSNFLIKKLYGAMLPLLPKFHCKEMPLNHSVDPRHIFILWLALLNRLSTIKRLAKLGIHVPPACVFCGNNDETHEHLFLDYCITRCLWLRLQKWLGIQKTVGSQTLEVEWVAKQAKGKSARVTIICCVFAMMVNTI